MNAFTVDEVFSKRIDISDVEDPIGWPCPLFSNSEEASPSLSPRLKDIKDSLNATKSSLNHLNLKEWHRHTSCFNSANALLMRIKHQLKPELYTQAWVKMIDILNVFFPQEALGSSMKTLHICESPGAFISATNHHLQNTKWSWKAISLNPYYEGNTYPDLNNDDRNARVYLSHWDYGHSDIGSVTEDIGGYFESLRDYEADLVTADGSINCLKTPNEQENMVHKLKTAETLLALRSLKLGGSLVIKFFTFFEAPTLRLLYVLRLSFRKMSVYKPVASKEGNSEVYVICREYNGEANVYLEEWIKEVIAGNGLSFPLNSIPESFVDWTYEAALFFGSWQQKVIERNLISYNINASEPKEFQYMILKEFFSRYELKKSWKRLKIAKLSEFELKMTRESKLNDGDFESRTQRISLSCIEGEKLKYLERVHEKDYSSVLRIRRLRRLQGEIAINLRPVFGRPFGTLSNSKYCCLSLIFLYQRALEHRDTKEDVSLHDVNFEPLEEPFVQKLAKEGLNPPDKCLHIPCDSFLKRESRSVLKKSICDGLVRLLNGIRSGESIALVGFPTFSRFYVGILFILSHTFEKLTLIPPDEGKRKEDAVIYLEELKDASLLPLLEDICAMLPHENPGSSLLSILPIDFILHDRHFYEAMLYFNFLCLLQRLT